MSMLSGWNKTVQQSVALFGINSRSGGVRIQDEGDAQAGARSSSEFNLLTPEPAALDFSAQPASGRPAMPRAGDTFLGFHLVEELGRGTFARVFLARQGDLADRPVVLKVSAGDSPGPIQRQTESQTLAQLQHTNIVPIFS